MGREVGEKGTPHIQGYVYFHNKKSFAQVKALIPKNGHIEPAMGTIEQNYEYCSKGGNFVEFGNKPVHRGFEDKTVQEKARATKLENIQECWEKAKKGDFMCLPPTHIKTWEYIKNRYGERPKDLAVLNNYWFWGASGVGKSHTIRQVFDMSKVFSKPLSSWWDNYAGEEIVLIEDYDPGHTKMFGHWMKIWCDHYAFNAQVKGSYYFIRPKILIVTSQYPLGVCFPCDEGVETFQAVHRRFGGDNSRLTRQPNNNGLQYNVTDTVVYKEILMEVAALVTSDN